MIPYRMKHIKHGNGTEEFRFYDSTFSIDTRKQSVSSDGCDLYNVPFDDAVKYDNSYNSGLWQKCYTEEELKQIRKAESLRCSVSRTREKIGTYARSEIWEHFVTFTFSGDKVNRYDYKACYSKLKHYIDYLRKLYPNIKYLIVPETHRDGAWHFHGLFCGLSDRGFHLEKIYDYRKRFWRNTLMLNGWKYGISDVSVVKSARRCSTYILKYITKKVCELSSGHHRYLRSDNLTPCEVFIDSYYDVCYHNCEDFINSLVLLYSTQVFSKVNFNEYLSVKYFYLSP